MHGLGRQVETVSDGGRGGSEAKHIAREIQATFPGFEAAFVDPRRDVVRAEPGGGVGRRAGRVGFGHQLRADVEELAPREHRGGHASQGVCSVRDRGREGGELLGAKHEQMGLGV